MTDKYKYFFILIAAALILAGCSSGGSYNPEEVEGAGYVLAGYYMMAGEETAISEGTSRATASTDTTRYSDYADKTFAELDGTTMMFANYPEQGQKTYVTVSEYSAGVYLMSSITEYPNRDDVIDYYLEEYYLRSDTGDSTGVWTSGVVYDPIDVEDDPAYRKTMEVHFRDGSVRYEWIADTLPTVEYANFDIDGDMGIPADEATAVSAGSSMDWSSKVYYYQNIQADIAWFEQENKELFGVRYYTESADGAEKTSLAFERIISQDTVVASGTHESEDMDSWIFSEGSGYDTLAETTIRYELIGSNNRKTTRAYSEIVNSFGNTITIDLESVY